MMIRATILLIFVYSTQTVEVANMNFIKVEIFTSDCLYADTSEPVSIQFFALEGRTIMEKSEKFALTQRGQRFNQGEKRIFHILKSNSYCNGRRVCSNLSFIGLFVGDAKSEVFDTWNTNNITVTFSFDKNINIYKFDFTDDGPCMRPLHFWSSEFWHRYGPNQEFEERDEEYALGDLVPFPTFIL